MLLEFHDLDLSVCPERNGQQDRKCDEIKIERCKSDIFLELEVILTV